MRSWNWVQLNWKGTSVKIIVIFGINRTQTGVKGHAKKVCRTFRNDTNFCKHDRDQGASGRATATVTLTVFTTEIRKERNNKPKGNGRSKGQITIHIYVYIYIYIVSYTHTHTYTHTHINLVELRCRRSEYSVVECWWLLWQWVKRWRIVVWK